MKREKQPEMTTRLLSQVIKVTDQYDEETEELSDDLKTISGDIYDLTRVNGGEGITIFSDAAKTTYKSTYQILKEIAGIWDELTDKQQADLLEKLGGKRGGQVLSGLLDDFSSVDQALETMQNAAGSSDREMSIIRDKHNCPYVQQCA